MLTIGLFAQAGQVTVQTLRHYDRLGLLKPSQVDRFTNYRYYTLDQLPRLYRILALKDLGLSLEQIGKILDDDISTEQLRGMLKLRRAELAETIADASNQLARVEAHIRQIEEEGKMPEGDVIIKNVEPMLVAGRRIQIPINEGVVLEDLNNAFHEVGEYVSLQGAALDKPCIAVWYTPPDQRVDEDVEAIVPLDKKIASSERVQVHQLPQVHVASVMHQGDFRLFGESYRVILSWIERNGYAINGPFREVYHRWERNDLDNVMVEIQFPVTKG